MNIEKLKLCNDMVSHIEQIDQALRDSDTMTNILCDSENEDITIGLSVYIDYEHKGKECQKIISLSVPKDTMMDILTLYSKSQSEKI